MGIVLDTLRGIAIAITNPYLILLVFFIGLRFHRRNKKTIMLQKMIIGQEVDNSIELTFSQICIGIIGGTIGSIFLNSLEVSFQDRTVIYVMFLLSILLMYIKPKFICFSYSGCILGLILLGLNYIGITDFSIGSLILLIGVMHLIEGILVMINGSHGAIPVFTNKGDRVIGGFALNRYWTVPIAFLQFMPFYSIIGYNNVTFSKTKKENAIISGLLIFIYGILVCCLGILSNKNYILSVISIILVPILHEGMLIIDNFIELCGNPLFISDGDGLKVLEVAPDSQAFHMGIESGDVLMEINNTIINSEKETFEYIRGLQNFIWVKIKKASGEIKEISYDKFINSKRLGLVLVPRYIKKEDEIIKLSGEKKSFKNILEDVRREQGEKKK